MTALIISIALLLILCVILAGKVIRQEEEIFDLKVNISEKNKLLEWQDGLIDEMDKKEDYL